MVKINEVTVDQMQRTFDLLISHLATNVIEMHNDVVKETNNFRLTAYERYSPESIESYLDDATQLYNSVVKYFNEHHQTYKLIVALIKYFNHN